MRRRVLAAISLVYFLRQAYRHIRACIDNEILVKQVKNLAVYSVSEVKELLAKSTPNQKIYCFVRGTS